MISQKKIKNDFPIFTNNSGLVYLDSTATSLKPKKVIDAISDYYSKYSANIHRGIYPLSEKASYHYEKAREKVGQFINAKSSKEIIFTRSTTESINLIAYCLGKQILKKNDEIVTTIMEHHSNFVPWQQLSLKVGTKFTVIDIDKSYKLQITSYKKQIDLKKYISNKTKILALTYVSNVLGVINPVKEIISEAKRINPQIITIVDAAQASPHIKINVTDLDCDFLAFSGHKMLGPTGIGVLWGKRKILQTMLPFNYGGDMIEEVSINKTTFAPLPTKFEAGTPHIAGVIGLSAAIDYLTKIGFDNIYRQEKQLITSAVTKLKNNFGDKIEFYSSSDTDNRVGIITFNIKNIHPHDVGQMLADNNICIRVGHHCAQPLHYRLGLKASCRASFYLYNSEKDIDKLITELKKAIEFF